MSSIGFNKLTVRLPNSTIFYKKKKIRNDKHYVFFEIIEKKILIIRVYCRKFRRMQYP